MPRRSVLLIASLSLACGGEAPPRPEVGVPVGNAAPPERPSVEDSVAAAVAAAGVRRHTDSVRRAVRAAAGVAPLAPATGDPYNDCMEQAAQAGGAAGERIRGACPRLRGRAALP